jgi:hypothetical protein
LHRKHPAAHFGEFDHSFRRNPISDSGFIRSLVSVCRSPDRSVATLDEFILA